MLLNVGFFAKDSGDAFVSYTVDLCNGPVNGFNNLCVFCTGILFIRFPLTSLMSES